MQSTSFVLSITVMISGLSMLCSVYIYIRYLYHICKYIEHKYVYIYVYSASGGQKRRRPSEARGLMLNTGVGPNT